MLDMGFIPDIEHICTKLPTSRQTMLFSATYPSDIKSLAAYALRPSPAFVDTVGESAAQTAEKVDQSFRVTAMEAQAAALWHACRAHAAEEPNFKIIAFFVTARLTQLHSELFEALGAPVLEMHSRKSQPARTRAADAFRAGERQSMFSSDVSARGVDYPDVTMVRGRGGVRGEARGEPFTPKPQNVTTPTSKPHHPTTSPLDQVIQVGLPSDKAQYIHRVGRTARAGKRGRGLLLLTQEESWFMRSLGGVPITEEAGVDLGQQTAEVAVE